MVTGQGLHTLKSRSLHELILSECSNVTDKGIMAAVSNFRNIKKLNLAGLHKLTDESIIVVAQSLGNQLVSSPYTSINYYTVFSIVAL